MGRVVLPCLAALLAVTGAGWAGGKYRWASASWNEAVQRQTRWWYSLVVVLLVVMLVATTTGGVLANQQPGLERIMFLILAGVVGMWSIYMNVRARLKIMVVAQVCLIVIIFIFAILPWVLGALMISPAYEI